MNTKIMTNLTDKLLKELTQQVGCAYVSDLHMKQIQTMLFDAAQKIDKTNYSLPVWSEAISYITGQGTVFHTIEDLESYLARLSDGRM